MLLFDELRVCVKNSPPKSAKTVTSQRRRPIQAVGDRGCRGWIPQKEVQCIKEKGTDSKLKPSRMKR